MKRRLKLQIDLVPRPSWGTSLHNNMPRSAWDNLRKQVHERNGSKCQICGSPDKLHCHELWEFDDKTHVQKLVGLGTICNMCHHVTHFGRSMQLATAGNLDLEAVVKHFLKVNGCDRATFTTHLREARANFEKRSKHDWCIDFGEYAHLVTKNAS